MDGEEEKSAEDAGLHVSSKAAFNAVNPDKKTEVGKDELIAYLIKLQGAGNDDAHEGCSEATKKALKNKCVENIIHKAFRLKGGRSLKESDMVAMNKRYMKGHLPKIHRDPNATSSEDDEKSSGEEDDGQFVEKSKVENDGIMQRALGHAVQSLALIKNYMEKVLSKMGISWLMTVLPFGQITTLVTFVLFSYIITPQFLSWFIPLFILGISMCIMIVSTMRIVRGVKRFARFKAWGEFLDAVGATQVEAIDTSKAEEHYILNHVSPYMQFLITCCFCVMAYSVTDKAWVLNAELGLFSLMMCGVIVVIHNMHKSKASIAIFVCQLLATAMEGFDRVNGGEVFGQFLSMKFPSAEVTINLNLPGFLRLWMLVQVAGLLRQKSYKTFSVRVVKEVLPHLLAAAWWEVAVMFLGVCTVHGVFRATAEFVALLFAMPLVFVISVLAFLKFVLSMELTKILLFVGVLVCPLVYLKVWKNKHLFDSLGRWKAAKALKPVLKLLALVALGGLAFFYRPSGLAFPNSTLAWEDYQNLCLSDKSPSASVCCREFTSYGILWKGTVVNVRVVSVTNEVERFVGILPHDVATWLVCAYGDRYPEPEECEGEKLTSEPLRLKLCSLAPAVKQQCHLQKYNIYKFQIYVSMPGGSDESVQRDTIVLEASHDFREAVFNLQEGSEVQFRGTIASKGSISVKALYTRGEDGESMRHVKRQTRIENKLTAMLDEAFTSLCRFIFYPVLMFQDVKDEGSTP